METGLNELKELFGLKDRDLRTYSPLTLAYIGDAVYEIYVREHVLAASGQPGSTPAQAGMPAAMQPQGAAAKERCLVLTWTRCTSARFVMCARMDRRKRCGR